MEEKMNEIIDKLKTENIPLCSMTDDQLKRTIEITQEVFNLCTHNVIDENGTCNYCDEQLFEGAE